MNKDNTIPSSLKEEILEKFPPDHEHETPWGSDVLYYSQKTLLAAVQYAQQLQSPGTSDAEIQRKDLLDLAKELRDTLFVRPSNLKKIESKAVALCDAVLEREESEHSDAVEFYYWTLKNEIEIDYAAQKNHTPEELYALFLDSKQSGDIVDTEK